METKTFRGCPWRWNSSLKCLSMEIRFFCFNKMFSAEDFFQSHKKYFLCHKNISMPQKNLGSVSHFFKNSGKSPIGLMMLLFNLVNKMRCWTKEIWKGQGIKERQRKGEAKGTWKTLIMETTNKKDTNTWLPARRSRCLFLGSASATLYPLYQPW